MAIEAWQVYYVRECKHTTPRKHKFVVLAYQDEERGGDWYGFFINSRVNPFYQRNPRLLLCITPISAGEHPFLTYDSWISVKEIYPYTVAELDDLRGRLSTAAINAVRESVRVCITLPRRTKRLILSGAS